MRRQQSAAVICTKDRPVRVVTRGTLVFLPIKSNFLEHGALALLGAGKNELWHAALLGRTNVNKATADGAIIAAHAVRSV